jgi:hypothetical protein
MHENDTRHSGQQHCMAARRRRCNACASRLLEVIVTALADQYGWTCGQTDPCSEQAGYRGLQS